MWMDGSKKPAERGRGRVKGMTCAHGRETIGIASALSTGPDAAPSSPFSILIPLSSPLFRLYPILTPWPTLHRVPLIDPFKSNSSF